MATLNAETRAIVVEKLRGRMNDATTFVLDNGTVLDLFRRLLDPEGHPGFKGDGALEGGIEQAIVLLRLAQENGVPITLQLDSPVHANSFARIQVK